MVQDFAAGRMGRRSMITAAGALAAPLSRAQGIWPERPVTLVCCFPPGGSTDTSARLVAPGMAEILGKPVVVENRAGAGGNIGIGYVARAAADGYTLLCASSVFVVNASLYRNAPYDPYRDFAPVGTLGASPNLICVRADSGITSLAQLIALAKAQPERFNYASPGIGTTPHLAGEVLKLRTGIQMQHIPFLGAGPAVQAILAGTVEVLVASQGGSVEAARASGRTLALAQTGATRSPDLPDVPTLGEARHPRRGVGDLQRALCAGRDAGAGRRAPGVRGTGGAGAARCRAALPRGGCSGGAGGRGGTEGAGGAGSPLWREVIRQAKIAVE
ncbi:Bug family tripartite tricarboxylate transporter substrate binding protein [Dankookia sp. P2]|uniref:Bug family tripartite tricarboxylate transporter substrate binding protein n=1 Tax=Dankookia sp. P2 TaxID=3423955 RepID=UPI003D67A265